MKPSWELNEFDTHVWPLKSQCRHAMANGNISKCATHFALVILFQQVVRGVVGDVVPRQLLLY